MKPGEPLPPQAFLLLLPRSPAKKLDPALEANVVVLLGCLGASPVTFFSIF